VNKPATSTRALNWLRISGLVLGVFILLWLTVEDRSELVVLLLSALICIWIGVWLLARIDFAGKYIFWKHVIIGGGMGLLLGAVALILMALKTGIHGHGIPDFSVDQMRAVVSLSPYFLLGGFLVGASAGLLRTAQMQGSAKES
jgi:hypothetical protein